MIILTVAALFLVLVGLGFFISALYLYLLTALHNNSALATFFTGLAMVVIAILLLLFVLLIKSSLFSSFKLPKKPSKQADSPHTGNPVANNALNLLQKYPLQTALFGLASGFLLGFSPKIRNSLIDGAATFLETKSIAESLKAMKSSEE